MSFTESRREFMKGSARAGAALAVVAGSGGALAAFASTMAPSALSALAAGSVAAAEVTVSPELLHALGARIGLEVTEALGAAESPVSLAYIDAAGPSVDALREGIERGIHWQAGSAAALREWQAPYCSLLGAALITNEATGQRALVEIDATALSMIAMVESLKTPASSHKHAVLTASADNLYRVNYLS